jgi:hypothetical protein
MPDSVPPSFYLRRRLLGAVVAASGSAITGLGAASSARAADLSAVKLVLGDQAGDTRIGTPA